MLKQTMFLSAVSLAVLATGSLAQSVFQFNPAGEPTFYVQAPSKDVTAPALPKAPLQMAAGDGTRQYELKDGSALMIYKDGKMSMTDKTGKPLVMKEGVKMETKDGLVLIMQGNEIWRLERPASGA